MKAKNTETYELASRGTRFIALMIDTILISIVGGIFGLELELAGGSAISLLFGVAYQWYFLTQHNGQTPGKMLMGIYVIKADGSEIDDSDAILRYFGYVIGGVVLGLGFIWAFFDPNNQGWHDKLAKTYVVTQPRIERNNYVEIKSKNSDYL